MPLPAKWRAPLAALRITEHERAVYRAHTAPLAAKHETLRTMYQDPDAFFRDVSKRFEAQKAKTPKDPYQFEFGDYGIPVLKQLDQAVTDEISKLQGLLEKSGKHATLERLKGRYPRQELETGLKYLHELQTEIRGHISRDSISYRRMQELGSFAAPALGHFDYKTDLTRFQRLFLKLDRHLEGYEKRPISEELRRYRQNEYSVYERESNAYAHVQSKFAAAMWNPNELKVVSLPTMEPLSEDAFTRILESGVVLEGVTGTPIPADGFMRPGKDFRLHDTNHNATITVKLDEYIAEHKLATPQVEKLKAKMRVWHDELDQAMAALPEQPREAVQFLFFNTHHDRGIPQVPSSYTAMKNKEIPLQLYVAMRIARQAPDIGRPLANLKFAREFLEKFWADRLPQEQAIWNARM